MSYDLNTAKARVESLRQQIEHHRRLYYENDAPEISDFAFDALFEELKDLENRFPELDTPDSPSHRVGGGVSEKFAEVKHPAQMGSLTDVFDFDALRAFVEGARQALIEAGEEEIFFTVEPKIDGLSVGLSYEMGNLVMGATRGDGFVGENVTENIRTIRSIPQKVDCTAPLVVRGEVYMPRDVFYILNAQREAAGEKLMANPRNAAAGSLRQLDAAVTAERQLSIFVFNHQWGSLYSDGTPCTRHSETVARMEELGFPVIRLLAVTESAEEILSAVEALGRERDFLPYDIDGAVVKIDSRRGKQYPQMGGGLQISAGAEADEIAGCDVPDRPHRCADAGGGIGSCAAGGNHRVPGNAPQPGYYPGAGYPDLHIW